MRYHHQISITYIVTGLILQLIYFLVLLPFALRAEGGWSDFLLSIYFYIFLFGVLDLIFGFYNLIKKKTDTRIPNYVAVINVCAGFLFLIFTYVSLILFLSGFIILYLGFKEED